MEITHLLEEIMLYLDSNRGVGHTDAMIKGLMHYPDRTLLLVPTHDWGRQIAGKCGRKDIIVVSMNDFAYKTRGLGAPLVIDNWTLSEICRLSLAEMAHIQYVERERAMGFQRKLEQEQDENAELRRDVESLTASVDEEIGKKVALRHRLSKVEGRWVNQLWDWVARWFV